MKKNDFDNSLDVAEQALVGAWYRGEAAEQAQLSIALDIVRTLRGQRRTNATAIGPMLSAPPESCRSQ